MPRDPQLLVNILAPETKTMDTIHAIISAITPNRATVRALGDEYSLSPDIADWGPEARIVLLPDTVELGERIWLDSIVGAA